MKWMSFTGKKHLLIMKWALKKVLECCDTIYIKGIENKLA
jgi:hypothetical protein